MTARSGITGGGAEAIARSVEAGLAGGRLDPRRPLPPVRALASELGVSPTTVAAAYRILRQRGVAVGDGRRGTRVARSEGRAARIVLPDSPGAVNLADGNPDPALLPDLGRLLARLPFPRDLYGQPAVLPELEKAGRRLFDEDGIDVPALAVVSGAMDGIERVLAGQLRPGDRVAVEDPAFAGLLDLLGALALVPVPVAADGDGLDPDALGRVLAGGVEALVVTPRAQNPTGSALSRSRARDLSRVLDRRPELLVIEDDHAAGIAGVPAVTLQSPRRRRHACVRSVAKALGPDVRVALLASSPEIIAGVEARQVVGMRWVSRLLQRLVATALADRSVTSAVKAAEKEYARRRRVVLDALAAAGVTARGASGLNVWIPVSEEAAAIQGLALEGWCVAPGERFRLKSGPGLRVTVSRLAGDEPSRFAVSAAAVLAPRRPSAST